MNTKLNPMLKILNQQECEIAFRALYKLGYYRSGHEDVEVGWRSVEADRKMGWSGGRWGYIYGNDKYIPTGEIAFAKLDYGPDFVRNYHVTIVNSLPHLLAFIKKKHALIRGERFQVV